MIRGFQKTSSYSKYPACTLFVGTSDDFEDSYEFPEFVNLKNENRLEHESIFDGTKREDWQKLAKEFNPATYICNGENRNKFEVFNKPWAKIYEILKEFQLIPDSTRILNTLHLGEQIGAMVGALHHYLKSNRQEVSHEFPDKTRIILFP